MRCSGYTNFYKKKRRRLKTTKNSIVATMYFFFRNQGPIKTQIAFICSNYHLCKKLFRITTWENVCTYSRVFTVLSWKSDCSLPPLFSTYSITFYSLTIVLCVQRCGPQSRWSEVPPSVIIRNTSGPWWSTVTPSTNQILPRTWKDKWFFVSVTLTVLEVLSKNDSKRK